MVKIERSQPAPESLAKEKLKKSGKYNSQDVIDRLYKDFNEKCYICELKELQDPVVEHLRPHKSIYIDKKFDWNNLFLACDHCNIVKNVKYENIIDCTKDDPESYMFFRIKDKEIHVDIKKYTEDAATTSKLIGQVFNSDNTPLRCKKTEYRRKKLFEQMLALIKCLDEYTQKLEKKKNTRSAINKIKALLRKETAFAAFKRCYIKDNINKYPELEEYI